MALKLQSPLSVNAQLASAMKEQPEYPQAAPEENDDPPTVLVVEDQPEVRQAIGMLLGMSGYKTVDAGSPEEAMECVRAERFDLILLDLNYRRDTTSGAEGLQLLSRLRGHGVDAPIVAMTAWGSVELAVQAMHGGATDFIQKPWDNSHMLRLVSQHVLQQQAQRSLRVRKEMEWAEAIAIQRRLLPRELPTVPGLSIAASCRAFDQLGGDYYDVLTMGDKLAICIGDVIGKGLPAALMMSNLQAAVKVTAAPWLSPSDLCHRVNELTCNNGASDKFISFFYCVLDLRTRRMTYSNCGHNPPILRRANGSIERLDSGGTLLGIRATERFQEATVSLAAGDRLLLFTDGLSEAENSAGDQFSEERLAQHLGSSQARSAQEILDEMLRAVDAHCGSRFFDDATAVVLCPE